MQPIWGEGLGSIPISKARSVLCDFGLSNFSLTYLRTSENMVWRVKTGNECFVLRCHRPRILDSAALPALGVEQIEAELKWLQALGPLLPFPVPSPICTLDGRMIKCLQTDRDDVLLWTLLKWIPGRQYSRGIRPIHLERAGAMAASLHNAARTIGTPPWPRPRWDRDRLDRAVAELNDSMKAGLLPTSTVRLVREAHVQCAALLDSDPPGVQYGFIHGDLNIQNLVYRGEIVSPIDFCSSGEGWIAFDLAHLIAFAPTNDYWDACLKGYIAAGGCAPPVSWIRTFAGMCFILWLSAHVPTSFKRIAARIEPFTKRITPLLNNP